MVDGGYWMLDARCSMLDRHCWMVFHRAVYRPAWNPGATINHVSLTADYTDNADTTRITMFLAVFPIRGLTLVCCLLLLVSALPGFLLDPLTLLSAGGDWPFLVLYAPQTATFSNCSVGSRVPYMFLW